MILVLLISNFINLELTYMNAIIKFVVFGLISVLLYILISYKNGLIYDILNIDLKEKIKNILKKNSKN